MANIKINKKITSVKYNKKSSNRITPERPKDLKCDIHSVKVKGVNHLVLVGLLNDKPYEVFVSNEEALRDIKKNDNAIIRKIKKGRYDLIFKNGEEDLIIDDITKKFDAGYGTLSRFISMSLRHDVPMSFIVDQLNKDKNFLGFERSVSRVLKKYIKEGEKVITGDLCPSCGSDNLVFQEGCKTCLTCGWSKCD